jgi:hypothetical protein
MKSYDRRFPSFEDNSNSLGFGSVAERVVFVARLKARFSDRQILDRQEPGRALVQKG